ncbi:hypothetical protein N9X15_03745 [Flavobacteriaceae bacterium]|nr:hypothetical protein [Flavobacteriaceae bacterium]
MTLEEFKEKTIGALPMPETLAKLFNFEENEAGLYYFQKFELSDEEIMGVDIDDEDEYNKYIKPFSYVDSGCCAFWLKDNNEDLENAPIIYFSSEGVIRIMAKDLKTFLRMLTFDGELDDGSFYKDKRDYEESEFRQQYIAWLKREFDLEPVLDLPENERYGDSPENTMLIEEAENLYKEDFLEWHKIFCDIEDQYL